MEPETSAPVAAPSASGHANRMKLVALALGVVAILVALGAAAFFYLEKPAGLTHELMERGVFISAQGAYIYRDGNFVPLSAEEGMRVLEAKQSNGHAAFIGKSASGEYSVRWDGEVIARSGYPMRGLALSPEGTKVAYAEQISGEADSDAISDWAVTVRDLTEENSVRTYPASFSPYFLGDTHMLRLTSKGILYTDLGNETEAVFAAASFDDVYVRSYQSPDRRAIAWETPVDGYSQEPVILIVGVTRVSPPESEFIGINHLYPDTRYALGADGFYELRESTAGGDLWVRTIEHPEAKKLYSFPAELGITRIMFQ